MILPENVTDEAEQYFEQIRRGQSVDPIEGRRLTKSGRLIDIAVRFSPIRDVSGQVQGMSAICRDITFQKAAEREHLKLALVAKHTDTGVVITDPEGLTEWVNEAFTKITGFTLAECAGHKPGHLLQGSDSDPATVDLMRKQIAKGEGFNVEIINYTKDKRPYWLAIEARPLLDENGTLSGFMAIQRDISKLKAAQAEAAEEVARRDTFLAMLSHELRNPLSAIQNGLVILKSDSHFEEEQRKEVEDVLSSQVAHVGRLLDDLLDVSRITQDKVIIQKKLIDLRDTAQQAVSVMQPLADKRGCHINLQLPDQPVVVDGDAGRLQQVQTNLLTNAIRHSNQGQPIELSMSTTRSDAVIEVSDVGEGITPQEQAKVFDLFFQTDSPIARSEGGLGVGLSLVRDFVAKHDGTVSVHSEGLGKGTRFTVTLPLSLDGELAEVQDQPVDARPMRIVIVEDQDANRMMLRQLLEIDGHEVWEAENGTQGVQLIAEHCPDIALVDIGLPDILGYEVAKQIRRVDAPHQTLMAALTGYGQDDDVQRAREAGFDVHLVKPLDTRKLADVFAAVGKKNSSGKRSPK